MSILKKIKDKTGTIHDFGDSRVDAFETELSGAAHNVPYSPAVLAKTNAIEASVSAHIGNTANPHKVTKAQIGLANVENKSSTQIRSELTKENVTNALGYMPIDESRIGAANGVASLDASGRIPASQIPGGFDNIEEYDNLAAFPTTGEDGKIYVAKDTNLTYRWTGSQYVEISPSLALGETATTAYRGDRGKVAYDHSQVSGNSTIHHTHANKDLLDSYTQTEADLANAVSKVHEHGNKDVLDGITSSDVANWNSKMDSMQTNDITIANGDKLVVTDASDSNKVARASLTFDGATTDKMISKKGEWSDTIAKARAVVDYGSPSKAIEIGWGGASVTSARHFAVYTDSANGYNKAIKDCSLATVKKAINGTSVGSAAVPVFINADGETQVCTDDFVHDGDVTSTYSSTGTAPVNGTAVAAAIGGLDVSSVGGDGKYISAISETDGKISATATTMDTTPTANSTKAVTSGGIKAALDGKSSTSHTHGNITNDGKIGSTADLAVVTGTSGAVTTADLTTASPTVPAGGTTTSLEFIDTVAQDSKGKISATKKAVPVDSTYSSTGTNPVNGKAIAAAIGGLDSNKTSTDGVNVQVKVTETDGKISAVNVTTDNTENKNNKVSKWQTTPDNTHYPSEKLVKDGLDGKANLTNSVAIFDGYVRRMNEDPGWRRVAYKQFNITNSNINALFRLYLIGSNNDHIGLGDLIVNVRFDSSGSAPEFKSCYLMSHKPLHTSIKLKVVGVAGNAVVEVWFKPPTFSLLMLSCLGNGKDVIPATKDWTFEKYINATDSEPVEDTANHIYVFSGTVRSVQLNIASPTNNNLVTMDANGLVKDSGLAKSSVESAIRKAGSAIQGVKVNNTTLTPDANKIVNVPLVTTSADGAMSAADKTKLDGIAAGTASPLMDGKASVGNSLKYAREDHVHPSDTSKEDKANKTTVVLGTSESKYPTDKAVAEFVNSSIATNTANYISNNGEPFTSVEQLEAYSGTVTNNDYAFVTGTDSEGNTYYDRYKATVSGETVTWSLEYRLNNSSFTAAQWSAINSGITSALVAKIHDHSNKDVLDGITSSDVANWNGKLNVDGSNATNEGVTAMMRKVPSGTADLNDDSSYFGDSTSDHAKIVRRPVLDIWNYIKNKISSVLGLTETNYNGRAATAGKALADASGNNIEETYQKKLGASVDASGVVSFPEDVCANGSETLATIRYLQTYYSQFPKAGQGITINKDSDGAPIILVKQWKPEGAQLTCQRANPGDLASWRMKNMNFDNMGRMSMVSDNYTYMPVPNDFGTAGQLLVSNGDGNAPKWKSGIGLPPIQKGFAYSGSGNSKKYAWLCHICKSSQSGGNDTIHATFKIYTNTTVNGLSATADVWYRRNNGKQGTTKGQLTWTHGTSPSSFTLHANVYDDLSNNININLYAYMGATYQRAEASLDNISSLNSTSTITNANTSLLTDFYSNNFATALPTLGTNLELK